MPGRGKGRPFQKGDDRAGRPKGSPNRITRVIRDIVNPAAPEILEDIVKRARVGDPFAQRAFLTLLPQQPKYVEGPIDLPRVKDAREALDALTAIAAKAGKGEVDLEGARFLIDTLRTFINGYAVVELENEVAKAKLREEGSS
jgi:hypothetical protein